MSLRLFHYWRSSASWRVRFGLELKKIPYEAIAINLVSGDQLKPEHLARNPLGLVPVLETQGHFLAESTAILEWLEETHPSPALLPQNPLERAKVRQLCQLVNASIQPFQNITLAKKLSLTLETQKKWNQPWIHKGLLAYEQAIRPYAGTYSLGGVLTMADLFLIPQVYNAYRFEVPLHDMPIVNRIYQNALQLPACQASHPDRFKQD